MVNVCVKHNRIIGIDENKFTFICKICIFVNLPYDVVFSLPENSQNIFKNNIFVG